jgi:hypothetical protein
MARLTWYTRGGGKCGKEVGEGLREEWPTRCRGHRSRDGKLKANDGRRRRIGSDRMRVREAESCGCAVGGVI